MTAGKRPIPKKTAVALSRQARHECLLCGVKLVRRPGEPPYCFLARRTCSRRCREKATRWYWERAKPKGDAAPTLRDVKVEYDYSPWRKRQERVQW